MCYPDEGCAKRMIAKDGHCNKIFACTSQGCDMISIRERKHREGKLLDIVTNLNAAACIIAEKFLTSTEKPGWLDAVTNLKAVSYIIAKKIFRSIY